jgi:hypothetical protein
MKKPFCFVAIILVVVLALHLAAVDGKETVSSSKVFVQLNTGKSCINHLRIEEINYGFGF